MALRMWMYDLAREQAPTLEHLQQICELTIASGYNALGLYLEHRFAYPSTPWMHGKDCLTPESIEWIQEQFPQLQIIPFVNLLGHFEGFLYAEPGARLNEKLFAGMQACANKPEFLELANGILDDVMRIFKSDIIHIGGDETSELAQCAVCKAKAKEYEEAGFSDGKAELFERHFGPLAQKVLDAGRRPAVWGDMFLEHPTALDKFPKETLIFHWQYFESASKTAGIFKEKGLEIVYCPTIQTYNATWMNLPQSERNVTENAVDAHKDGVFGVCVTTWECGLFGNYETIFPAIRASGKLLQQAEAGELQANPAWETTELKDERGGSAFLKEYLAEGEDFEEWARLMGIELLDCGGVFTWCGIRSSLKCRLLLYSNPFLAWLHHRDEMIGETGKRALNIIERAVVFAPNASYRGVTDFGKSAIQFIQFAEQSHLEYAKGHPGAAVAALTPCRQIFDNLSKIAQSNYLRIGGSTADQYRCIAAKLHVEKVISRIKEYGDGSLGYLPSYEMITHPCFVPHDQSGWWLINNWAKE